ncbi:hypothetical protein ACHAWF_011018, partial [Thalassiosira exigua]
ISVSLLNHARVASVWRAAPSSPALGLATAAADPVPPTPDDRGGGGVVLRSRCSCRRVVLDVSLRGEDDGRVWNCHCAPCRRYHAAARVGYLAVPRGRVSVRSGEGFVGKFPSSCDALPDEEGGGGVERWHCTACSSKLLSEVAAATGDDGECWVNLGPLDDDAVPGSLADSWKERLKRGGNNFRADRACSWADALPGYRAPPSTVATTTWTGGCACGACRYEVAVTRPAQLQHCYCHLCRELSGAPFMTWIPIYRRDFVWESTSVDDAAGC